MRKNATTGLAGLLLLAVTASAAAEVRVQDIARLQGQRTNRLLGYGLVVGLPGTGDGDKYAATMRALMALHERYHQPILTAADVKGNNSVAIVTVEASIPEFGAREGQTVDVVVSSIGSAKSIRGGQLLMTPLQSIKIDPHDESTWTIFAWAGGAVETPDENTATRGIIRQGATIDEDVFYWFIEDGAVTLVLEDTHAGYTWAHMVARALNHELSNPADNFDNPSVNTQMLLDVSPAEALGPKNIRVKIPPYELRSPANFISRVLQTPLFMLPEQAARVTINRTTQNVAFTGNVTISPTVLQIPGLGTVLIGKTVPGEEGKPDPVRPVAFEELLSTLAAIRVTPAQLIAAIEHLHKSGSLHAQLHYE